MPPPPPPSGPNEDISIDGQGNPTIEVVQTPDPTSGGDVGDGIDIAQARAYERVDLIGWRERQFRKDIGYRALARLADNT